MKNDNGHITINSYHIIESINLQLNCFALVNYWLFFQSCITQMKRQPMADTAGGAGASLDRSLIVMKF